MTEEDDHQHKGHIVPTREMLLTLSHSQAAARSSKEPPDKVLANLTHLQLNDKNLSKISNLKFCVGLRVLYLYDNHIARIENLDFASHLTHLYLQNNELEHIENLSELKKLQKLYLDGNHIREVSGLDSNLRLEELTINRQRLPVGGPGLTFSPQCMDALSHSLCVLKASNCQIRDDQLVILATLKYLEECELGDNNVTKIEYVQHLASECPKLSTLDLRGNPVCKKPKYRNQVVMHGDRLRCLDFKDVTSQEREFVLRLQIHKSKLNQKKQSGLVGGRGIEAGIMEEEEEEMVAHQDSPDISNFAMKSKKKKQLSQVTIGLEDLSFNS